MNSPSLSYALFRRFIIQQCLHTGAFLTEELILSFWNDPKCERDDWEEMAGAALLYVEDGGELSDIPEKINGEKVSKDN